MRTTLLSMLFVLFTVIVKGQTFTTVQDGNWTSASTWDANGVPPSNLSNDVVNINHRVTRSATLKLQGNNTLNVNHILRLDSGSIEIEETTDVVNIDFGLIITVNGNVLNKKGTVNFNYGRIQMCNDGYKDESSSPQGTFGIGSIFSQNGNIEDSNSGNYSSNIEWCTIDGNGVNMPISENCSLVDPPGASCDDEVSYLTVICSLDPTDTDGDGVSNVCDIDDDNDGVTDEDELNGLSTRDTDGDGLIDSLDIDSDNDGIPDNVEAQLTIGYIAPTGAVDTGKGMLLVYGSGLTPVDTDDDGINDIIDLDSDADGIPDIQENGMANSTLGVDTDSDGLDNAFEGSNLNDGQDPNDEISNPSSSILPDADGDVNTGGDLDYRDLFDTNPAANALLDFDGIDDYLSTDSFIEGTGIVTIMAWVKIDNANSGVTTIAGEDRGCKLWLKDGELPRFSIMVEGNPMRSVSSAALPRNEWHHIAGTYSNVTGVMNIYIDGKLKGTYNSGVTGKNIITTGLSTSKFEVGRTSRASADREYFKGAIDEVRVFDVVLTEDQIQRMVYQEIENNSGNVRGSVIDKDIIDMDTQSTISWNNLIAYYPMRDIKNNTTSDYSSYGKQMRLYHITTVQEQTAPMPYIADSNGNWTNENTWLHGNVWDIEDVSSNKDWSIVQISGNVTTSNSHKNLGLIIDNNKKLTVSNDNQVNNSWYLELNGTLDLEDDSQLIQTENSDLVTSTSGKILRRQEGNTSVYWYNYWSSPVGTQAATTLTNNNASSNNANNTTFALNMLKEGNGSNVQFTAEHDEVGKISTRWTYTYINGLTYFDWFRINSLTTLDPGVGYTQKGTGNAGSEQQYIFEGKPNNGTILVSVTDAAPGSEFGVSKTDFLLGNPYPSALDIHQFIDDNAGIIDGTLQLWQQWSGSSHNLDEYDGGYAQVNKLGSVRAYQFVGIEGANNGSQDGTKTPTKYLPVGQGFMTEIVASGNIEFNNSQRVFIKEADANGNYNNGSVFFRTSEESEATTSADETDNENEEEVEEGPLMKKIRLEFTSVDGPQTRRELLLGFSEFTTDEYDYGYDAKNADDNADDLSTVLDGQKMLMQAYSDITPDKVVPLVLNASGDYSYELKITELENIAQDQKIYLKDNLTGIYYDLSSQGCSFSSEAGEFDSRFEIVFQSEEDSLGIEESEYEYNLIYYSNQTDQLFVKDLTQAVDKLMLINIQGQIVQQYDNLSAQALDNGIQISGLSTGTYIVYFTTDNRTKTKKIIIN
ncbi:LamG-like jellyroll fold domain-containing protein [Winogradskyella sp. 3972H.M.0a.05]|uniref:LamG-like jellyroll fold domain-containing protein n=1 Tax=Winogradskyella sp. 3972H.M.0a.05 TaxID=2950277 RepID=UPI0033980ECC